jgi:hypothetical protein
MDPKAGVMVRRMYPRLLSCMDRSSRLVDSLGEGDGRAGLPPIVGQREQLPQLELRIAFGLACLPQPDLAACQRAGTAFMWTRYDPLRCYSM